MTSRERIEGLFTRIGDNFFVQKELASTDFEKEYIAIRAKENRLYSDEIVSVLPEYSGHPALEREWLARKSSTQKLLRYLDDKKPWRNFLELGCGNGWLSHQLVKTDSREVTSLDINRKELEQAARVFKHAENITFVYADIFTAPLGRGAFDCIVLGSCIQYFRDAPSLLNRLLDLLSENGEIHILDSPLYNNEDMPGAQARSREYFRVQHPEMESFYFHHGWNIFDGLNFSVLAAPSPKFYALFQRWLPVRSPFAWIRIKK
jgi:SAM-dependent methyltransferase